TSTSRKFAVLGLLSIEPMSGYDLRRTIQQSISHFWQEGYGQIYPTLKDLVAEGLATLEVQQQSGKPNRRVYTLTGKGLSELKRWLGEPATELSPTRNELLLKLFFGRHGTSEDNIKHLNEYRSVLEAKLSQFEAIEADLPNEPDSSGDMPYWLITLRSGIYACRAGIAWCDETLVTLKKLETDRSSQPPRPGKAAK
ncbi:MAG TPA: PadR family transcriptional regulator, partial [Actinomycetota bacterium]|nr:PadR family transcriptional regulator [Actinomycetota bacterium]